VHNFNLHKALRVAVQDKSNHVCRRFLWTRFKLEKRVLRKTYWPLLRHIMLEKVSTKKVNIDVVKGSKTLQCTFIIVKPYHVPQFTWSTAKGLKRHTMIGTFPIPFSHDITRQDIYILCSVMLFSFMEATVINIVEYEKMILFFELIQKWLRDIGTSGL